MTVPCQCGAGNCLLCPPTGDCTNRDRLLAEGRRYLYRNVACEARKLSGLEKHIPDVRGWV